MQFADVTLMQNSRNTAEENLTVQYVLIDLLLHFDTNMLFQQQ